MAAEQCFRTSINLNPHDPIFHANLAQAFAHSEQASQAREAYQKAIDLDPASASFRTQFGWFLVEDGKPGEAEDSFREALQRDHECENASSGLATVLAMRSELEVGMAVLRPFISAIRPHVKVASSYATLCRKTDQAAQALPVVRRAIRPGVSRSDEVALRFAEGDLLDSMGNVDAAFDAYQRANQAQASGYDAAAHKHFVDSLISTFTPALFASMSSPTIDTSASVLVCGMPRSGSGLVSKVLGQHSDVFVAGELDDLSTMAREIGHFVGVEGRYPELISDLDGELVAKLSMARMESLRRVSGAPFVVDTFSNNFLHLGLAAIVTPGAKVIHTVRDPVDTCLSCYFQHFGGSSFAFSNRLDAISSYFSQYHRLMKHWEQVLPLEVLTVQYQDLVGDTDQVSARLLGFIGRDWDADIREAQKSQIRAAAVAYAHVRDPIAPEESNNSERYRHHIGELVAVASLRP
jgi:Flp pilus assembly protein TadD